MNISGAICPTFYFTKGTDIMKNILSKLIELLKPQPLPNVTDINVNVEDEDAVVKTLVLYPYFIYSYNSNKIVGEIMLTEEQARMINHCLKGSKQDISFLRM